MRGFSCVGVGLAKSRFLYCRWRVGVRGTGVKELKFGASGEDEGGCCDGFEKREGEDGAASMKLIVGYSFCSSRLSVMVVEMVTDESLNAVVAEIEMPHVMARVTDPCPALKTKFVPRLRSPP